MRGMFCSGRCKPVYINDFKIKVTSESSTSISFFLYICNFVAVINYLILLHFTFIVKYKKALLHLATRGKSYTLKGPLRHREILLHDQNINKTVYRSNLKDKKLWKLFTPLKKMSSTICIVFLSFFFKRLVFWTNWLRNFSPRRRFRHNYIHRISTGIAFNHYHWFTLQIIPCASSSPLTGFVRARARFVSEREQLPVRGNQDYLPSQIIHELNLCTSFPSPPPSSSLDPVCKPLLSLHHFLGWKRNVQKC